MRRLVWLVLFVATPALAQSGWGPGTPVQSSPGPQTPAGVSQPASPDTNATSGDDAKAITPPLPPLPVPDIDENAAPAAFVRAAEVALAAGRDGEAEESIERAEARLLDRDIDPRRIQDPSGNPVIALLAQAREALSGGDRMRSVEILEQARTALAGAADQAPAK